MQEVNTQTIKKPKHIKWEKLRLTLLIVCTFRLTFTTKASFIISTGATSTASTSFARLPSDTREQIEVLQMRHFAKLTIPDYEKLTGKKLNIFQRLSFRLTKHRINNMLKAYDYGDGPTTLEKISWFIKGLILGPIALILGYIFLHDQDRALIKWIWFGFAGFVIIIGVIFLTI